METIVEQLVTFPIDDEFTYGGKIDLIEPKEGRIVDYKGVSSISDFIDRRAISYQVEFYAIAAKLSLGIDIKEVEYRLIERPGIKFCGKDHDDPELYEKRCRLWLRQDGKLKKILVPINPESLKTAKKYLKRTADRIRLNRELKSWIPNEHACHDWSRTCEFLPLCTASKYGADVGALIEKDYKRRDVRHPELGRNDPNTITYTSSGTLFQCETKSFWKDEMQLVRAGEMPSEAMYIGSAVHLGMETLARGGLEAARMAVLEWGNEQKVIGQKMAHKRDEMIAKAKAMVYTAAEQWFGLKSDPIYLPKKTK